MRILRKTHFWQDKRTFLDIDAEPPQKNDRGYAEEGNVVLKIADEEGIKAAFKLSVDEARALVGTVTIFLEKHDIRMAKLLSERQESDYGDSNHETTPIEPVSFGMFETPEVENDEKPKLQFYY